jgi:Meiotically up-regulated gene 113
VKKQHILDEIRRTAQENGGAPLGTDRFAAATGIGEAAWRGRYWARWNDAVKEAGFTPNIRRPKAEEDVLLLQLAGVIRELGRYPTVSEMRMRKRLDDAFPNHKVLERRGSRPELVRMLIAFCQRVGGWDDVMQVCQSILSAAPDDQPVDADSDDDRVTGYVYLALMRVGREKRFKIGKANLVEQRTRQVAVKLPEDLELIHAISTDDAYGIEAYWHKRFAEKRRGGEWFELTADDVRVFKRRKFM